MYEGAVVKVLFVWPTARWSIWDVARGYHAALEKKIGKENIVDYFFDSRLAYHRQALPEQYKSDMPLLSKLASETILVESLYANVDAVLIFSGLTVHAAALWLLHRCGIPAHIFLTESPYEDDDQHEWVTTAPSVHAFTNERVSAEKYGWTYLPHAFDPAVHRKVDPEGFSADVLIIGTGWPERIALLESIDWTGIDLKIFGVWPQLSAESPLRPFYTETLIQNTEIAKYYSGAKICLNFHRASLEAESLGPRAYEIAGCEAFQLCDPRRELVEVFGTTVPTFNNATELKDQITFYLTHDLYRRRLAAAAHTRVTSCTFDHRVSKVLDTLQRLQPKKEIA